MRFIKRVWHTLSCIGLDVSIRARKRQKVVLLNQVLFVSICMALIGIVVNFLSFKYINLGHYLLLLLLVGSCYLLVSKRQFLIAKLIFAIGVGILLNYYLPLIG
jgi:hypothetical protein